MGHRFFRDREKQQRSGTRADVRRSSLDFATILTGTTADLAFMVTNAGARTLTGSAATAVPGFTIVGGAAFSLGAGASQSVTVRFSPPSAATFSGNVTFTSNGGTGSPSVTGTGVTPPRRRRSASPLPTGARRG